MESDLERVIKARDLVLSPADIKSYMRMLLSALDACHSNWVVHRWASTRVAGATC
jgi:cyclin-dependent kinase 7